MAHYTTAPLWYNNRKAVIIPNLSRGVRARRMAHYTTAPLWHNNRKAVIMPNLSRGARRIYIMNFRRAVFGGACRFIYLDFNREPEVTLWLITEARHRRFFAAS